MSFDLLLQKLSPDIMEVTAITAQAYSFISVWCDPDQPETDGDGRPFIYCLVKEFGGIVNRAQAVGLTLHATLQ